MKTIALAAAAAFFTLHCKPAPAPAPSPAPEGKSGDAPPVAVQGLSFGRIEYAGSGCNEILKVAPDTEVPGRTELRFEKLVLRTSTPSSQSLECSFSQPINVPGRSAIRMVGGEWSGRAKVAKPGKGTVERHYYFSGEADRSRVYNMDAGFEGTFFFRDDLRDELKDPNAPWGPCLAQPRQLNARGLIKLSGEGAGTLVQIFLTRLFDVETKTCDPDAPAEPPSPAPAPPAPKTP